MKRTEAVAWVLSVCTALRLSQAKTLAHLTAAALHVGRLSLAALGRQLAGKAACKHRIKRAWRFCANERVVVSDAMGGVIARLCQRRKKPLLVAVDWTDVRGLCTLMAAAVLKGRAVPLLWASYPKWRLHKSQNNLEEGLLRLLRDLVPAKVPVILLADRGFGRTELARTCQQLGLRYVVRIRPDVYVACRSFRGKLLDLPVQKGVCRLLRDVAFRKEEPVVQHVVVRWVKGLPAQRDECWFLMTDLARGAKALSELYGQRMVIEELFRDLKGVRHGFALRQTQLKQAGRLDRLLLVVALAYILLLGLGLHGAKRQQARCWGSSNRVGDTSAFGIGRVLLNSLAILAQTAWAAVVAATVNATPNWG